MKNIDLFIKEARSLFDDSVTGAGIGAATGLGLGGLIYLVGRKKIKNKKKREDFLVNTLANGIVKGTMVGGIAGPASHLYSSLTSKVAEETFFQKHKKTILGVGAGIGAVGAGLLGKKMLGGIKSNSFGRSKGAFGASSALNKPKKPLTASPNFKEEFAAKAEQGKKIRNFTTPVEESWKIK